MDYQWKTGWNMLIRFFEFLCSKTQKHRDYVDVIPKMVDEYHQNLNKFVEQTELEKK